MPDPQRLGDRYELLGPLSTGSSGAVWCGRDLRTGSGCIVRVLKPGFAADPVGGNDLLGTLDLVGRLAHPNIVTVDDVVTDDGCSALVMPLISGESLRARIARLGPLDPAEATPLIAQLCDALYAAHAAGLAHGRIKPSNVLLEPGPDTLLTVKLTDFGMAVLDGRALNHTLRGAEAAATAAQYKAPELDFAIPATPAADIYAAGVVLYETLAGHPPFTGTRAGDIARLHREAKPPRIPGLPDAIWLLLTACLAKQPHLRPSAGSLAGLLRGIAPISPAHVEPVRPKAPTTADLPLFEAPGPPAEPTVVIAPAPFTRRAGRTGRRALLAEIALTAGLAALAGTVTYVAVGGTRSIPPALGPIVVPATETPAGTVVATAPATAGRSAAEPTASASPTVSGDSPGAVTHSNPGAPLPPSGSPGATTTAPPSNAPAPGSSTSSGAGPVTGLPVADPIGFLENMRAQIQALVAQGRATIDPVAAGDLQNLVLDLENSVIAYQQNGGAAHLQEIKNKIAAFDARLTLLVGQGRISQSAANQLAAYLQQLSPP